MQPKISNVNINEKPLSRMEGILANSENDISEVKVTCIFGKTKITKNSTSGVHHLTIVMKISHSGCY